MTSARFDLGELEYGPRPRLDRSLTFWILAACLAFWFFLAQVLIKLF
jgi:hypothetical protein